MFWRMHAGRDEHNGGFRNLGHVRYVQAHGHTEVVPVIVTEDPDGTYCGWVNSDPSRGDEPYMIQGHLSIFRMQFPYGPDAEEKAGNGRIVRLTITKSDLTAN